MAHARFPSLPPVDWAAPHEDALDQLERQVVRSSHFTQAVIDKLVARLARAEASLAQLVGLLEASGILVEEDADEDGLDIDDGAAVGDASAVDEADETVSMVHESEAGATARACWPAVAFRADPEDAEPAVEVNCAERMPICHAVCCKLNFALTPPEVEAGTVKWDLGFPYFIRHESNGYCTHNDTATGCCTIYADRPQLCRRYSCANDPRIWKDFDNMVLNEDWIRENLADRGRILVRPSLPLMEPNGSPAAHAWPDP